jgi:hypothetical protein
MSEKQEAARIKPVRLGSVMARCGLSVFGVVVAIAAVVGVFMALPTIGSALAGGWYGWAKLLTHDYTSAVPATLTEWGSFAVVLWSGCVASKLADANDARAWVFAGLAVVALLLGLEPAQCALWAVSDDWHGLATMTPWQLAAAVTMSLVAVAHFLVLVVVFVTVVM